MAEFTVESNEGILIVYKIEAKYCAKPMELIAEIAMKRELTKVAMGELFFTQ